MLHAVMEQLHVGLNQSALNVSLDGNSYPTLKNVKSVERINITTVILYNVLIVLIIVHNARKVVVHNVKMD
jgi:hypothetical protein